VAAFVVAVFHLLAGFSPKLRRFTVGRAGSQGVVPPELTTVDGMNSPKGGPAPEPASVLAGVAIRAVQQGAATGAGDSLDDGIRVPSDGMLVSSGTAATVATFVDEQRSGDALRQALCIVMALALVGGVFLFGYEIAIPAFILLYFTFVYRWVWWGSVLAAAIMGGIAYAAAHSLGTIFPVGII
jgi:hypothetical protein